MIKPKQINIFDYNDFRKYLADYQEARQTSEKSFSKSECSRLLGLPNTRSFFNDVIAGKKVSLLFIERFVKVLKLSKDEAQFFRVLVLFNQADQADQRELYFDQLVSLNRTPKRILDKAIFSYYKTGITVQYAHCLIFTIFRMIFQGLQKKFFLQLRRNRRNRRFLFCKTSNSWKECTGVF